MNMNNSEKTPSSFGIKNNAPNQGAQGIFNAPVYINTDPSEEQQRMRLQKTIERFKEATAKEKSVVGPKYIPNLYYPRPQIEANFKQFLISEASCFLIVAKAGRGKTNLMCRIVDELQDRCPVLFLSGRIEPRDSNDILKRISSHLGYEENWLACFKDLGTTADSGLTPIILIDGINESAAKPQMMQEALCELLRQAHFYKIKVCVTCRTDFWKFYRSPFWRAYTWGTSVSRSIRDIIRGEDLPLFPEEDFDQIVTRYFKYFKIQGQLVDEAWDRCRNPLLLRFFCEAYGNRDEVNDVGVVSLIRLYPLFKEFWETKLENIQSIVYKAERSSITDLIFLIARLMHQYHRTQVPKEVIAKEVSEDLTRSDSLYMRVLDEEIILEEELDELTGSANVIFVYDKFAEFAIALHIFNDSHWLKKTAENIVSEAIMLMEEEQQGFATLRGALEFLTLRLEDFPRTISIHFNVIRAMLEYDWKWRRIGTLLAFQLSHLEEKAFWDFMSSLVDDKRDFIRRICAEQLNHLARSHTGQVLPLLNRLLQDRNASVAQAAKASLLTLDATSAIQAAEHLMREQLLGPSSTSFAVELLLWPADSLSTLLQEKCRWLVKENRSSVLQNTICTYFTNLKLPFYEDLYILEELEIAFQVDWENGRKPDNPYLEMLRLSIVPRKAALKRDLECLDTLSFFISSIFNFTVNVLKIPSPDPMTILLARLQDLIPDTKNQESFLEKLEQKMKISLRHLLFSNNPSISIIELALEIAAPNHVFNGITPTSYLSSLNINNYISLINLCSISEYLLQEADKITGRHSSSIGLNTDLEQIGLHLGSQNHIDFLKKVASEIGVEVGVREQRSLSSLGRLSLWFWQTTVIEQEQTDAQREKIEQVAKLTIVDMKKRLTDFEAIALPKEAQNELFSELQALCAVYASSQPDKIVDALTPIIIWVHENDSAVLNRAFQTLYRRDPESCWIIGNALLKNEDQRLIDFASQILEQMEYAEEEAPLLPPPPAPLSPP